VFKHVSQAHTVIMDVPPLQRQCLNTHLQREIHRLENQPDSRSSTLQDEKFARWTSACLDCISAVAARSCYRVNPANML